jgi:hypothetical protein
VTRLEETDPGPPEPTPLASPLPFPLETTPEAMETELKAVAKELTIVVAVENAVAVGPPDRIVE